jgi:hypothetical protein
MCAVTGAHSLLKMVTKAKIMSPNKPTISCSDRDLGSCVYMKLFQVHAAVASAHSSRMAVLCTVPLRVMPAQASIRPPYWPLPYCLNVSRPKAGFEVFICGILLPPWIRAQPILLTRHQQILSSILIPIASTRELLGCRLQNPPSSSHQCPAFATGSPVLM